jgi:hypothetical protein
MQFDLIEPSIQKLSLESHKQRDNSPNVTIDDNLMQKSVEAGVNGLQKPRGSIEMHQVRIEPPIGIEQSRKLRL